MRDSAATRPISSSGWRMVVRGGSEVLATRTSSNPMTETSSGTRRPDACSTRIAPLAMKSLGGNGSIVTKAGIPVEDALRYVLSLPIVTLVSGIDSEKVLDQNLKIVRGFQPMTEQERRAVESRTLAMAGDGRYELFKSSKAFDGPVHRKQHGFDVTLSA